MGTYMVEPSTHQNFVHANNASLKASSCEMQGWRRSMEDTSIIALDLLDNLSVFAVFDGHGGGEVSKMARLKFLDFLKKRQEFPSDVPKALRRAFQDFDNFLASPQGQKEMLAFQSNLQREVINAGCTANVVVVSADFITCANAGDSRAVLSRGGKALPLSSDHKPNDPAQLKRIKEAGGQVVNGRVNGILNLSRSFGDLHLKRKELPFGKHAVSAEPDILHISRTAQDQFILIGCDGVWQNFVEDCQGMVELVEKSKGELGKMLESQVSESCLNERGCDNMTAVLVRMK